MELLHADDLVLLADSMKELIEKVKRWRAGLEENGLRINLCKTKIMKCCDVSHQVEQSCKFPCEICGKGVGSNSIKCTSCMAWIHKKCSAVKGRLQNVADIFKSTECASNVTITQTADIKDIPVVFLS
jgi:hypothetical protein